MLNITERKHAMFDVALLGKTPDSVILSIAIAHFNFKDGITSEKVINIDPKSGVDAGFRVDPSTVDWWNGQPEAKALMKKNRVSLTDAMLEVNEFVNDENILVWSCGTVLDFGAINASMEVCGVEPCWKFFNVMDLRTLYNVIEVNHFEAMKHRTDFRTVVDNVRAEVDLLISTLKGE